VMTDQWLRWVWDTENGAPLPCGLLCSYWHFKFGVRLCHGERDRHRDRSTQQEGVRRTVTAYPAVIGAIETQIDPPPI
jgi:hypothetical protein